LLLGDVGHRLDFPGRIADLQLRVKAPVSVAKIAV